MLTKPDQPIFIVKPRTYHSIDEIYAIFDAEEKAEQFINRFKTKEQELVIVKQVINPSYFADHTSDPYFITLNKTSFVPKDIFICDTIRMVEDARKEMHSIFFHGVNSEDDGEFIFQCIAKNKKTALSKAIAKRDMVVNNGNWKKCWDQHTKRTSI